MKINKKKDITKFENIKDRIIDHLDNIIDKTEMGIYEEVDLIDGFVNLPFTLELSSNLIIGGSTIPMIMLCGRDSGRIYFFALKAIIEEMQD